MGLFSNLKISQKLWILTTTIILVLATGFYFYFAIMVQNQFREGLLKKGTGLVQTSSVNLGSALYFNDDNLIKSILEGLQNDPDIEFIFVADKQDKMRFGYHYSRYNSLIKNFLKSNQMQRFDKHLLVLKQSIFFQDEFQGDIVLGFNLYWVNQKVATQTRNLLIIAVSLSLLLIILSSIISKAISRPLKEAAHMLNEYSGGDDPLTLRLPVKGNDEIAQLSSALNHLADNLEKNLSELNDSKKYLETLFQLSPIPILISDTMGNIEVVNESASSFFGVEHSILVQMNLERFFQPEDLNAIFNRVLQEMQDIRGFVTTMKLTDGSKKVVELNIASHQDELNFVKNIIIAIIDITEKIQIQREILQNQTKLQRINKELTHKTAELQRLSSWNKKNAQNLAYLIEISQQMMRASTANTILKIMIEDGMRLLDADECFIYLWKAESNKLIASLASSTEVLDRISTSVSEGDNFIWETQKNNEAYVRDSTELKKKEFSILGLDPEDEFSLISVPISEREYHFGVISFIKRNHQSFRVEDVHLLSTLANQTAILLDNMHLVHALKDKATSLERAYSELQKSQQQVIQLQKMESLGTLVGGIAHDFNNILGIIIPNTDLLRNDANGNPKILRRAQIINEAAQRAADLTRQLLMFSRNQDVQLKVLSPNQLITRLTSMLKRTLGKEYDILVDLDPEVEDIEGDETRLTQVLINLAVNARDAMPGGGKIILKTTMRRYRPRAAAPTEEKEYACISVTDTGKGIAPDHLDKIFDPFFTTKSVGKGTGLGLSVVYGIMQSHKGFVEVESEVGKGSTFYLYLPPSSVKRVTEEVPTKTIPRGTENILIVDDEKMIRESVSEILTAFGYRVQVACNGMEAVKIVQENQRHFQLAIVDMSMPKMNGIETIRRLRQLDPDLKLILSSGYLDRDRTIPPDLKIDGALPKPYRMRELALKIREILNQKIKTIA
ncbi:MAG: hypothetical protein Kow0042_28880 [Calditrichia bacterium]